jgi:hypothetical protein
MGKNLYIAGYSGRRCSSCHYSNVNLRPVYSTGSLFPAPVKTGFETGTLLGKNIIQTSIDHVQKNYKRA